MFLNLFRRHHYFVVYRAKPITGPIPDENSPEYAEGLRHSKQYAKYFEALQRQGPLAPKFDALDSKILKWVENYFWWRGRRVEYFEPYTSKNHLHTFIIVGTVSARDKIKRQALIFMLELFARMENPNIEVSQDFPQFSKEIEGTNLDIYKVKL